MIPQYTSKHYEVEKTKLPGLEAEMGGDGRYLIYHGKNIQYYSAAVVRSREVKRKREGDTRDQIQEHRPQRNWIPPPDLCGALLISCETTLALPNRYMTILFGPG